MFIVHEQLVQYHKGAGAAVAEEARTRLVRELRDNVGRRAPFSMLVRSVVRAHVPVEWLADVP
jgi:hypothetical protein